MLPHSSPNAGRLRRTETGIACFSLVCLLLYAPLETLYSWPGLWKPGPGYVTGYLVDVIAFVLLFYGGVHSLRRRPGFGIAPLCAAWGFCACLGWRSYFGRVTSRQRGLHVYENENLFVENLIGMAMLLAFAMLFLCLYVAHRQAKLETEKKIGGTK